MTLTPAELDAIERRSKRKNARYGQSESDNDVLRLVAAVRSLRTAARQRVEVGHSGTCPRWAADDVPCLCGHDALAAALGGGE